MYRSNALPLSLLGAEERGIIKFVVSILIPLPAKPRQLAWSHIPPNRYDMLAQPVNAGVQLWPQTEPLPRHGMKKSSLLIGAVIPHHTFAI